MTLGRFSEVHEFEKPNDGQALNLMNSCAVAVLEEFRDVVFSYGVSDEYRYQKLVFVYLELEVEILQFNMIIHFIYSYHCFFMLKNFTCSFVLRKDSQFCQRLARCLFL